MCTFFVAKENMTCIRKEEGIKSVLTQTELQHNKKCL